MLFKNPFINWLWLYEAVGVLNFGLEAFFNGSDKAEIAPLAEDNVPAFFASSARATSPVDKRVNVAALVVDHNVDIVDVKTSGSDIGCHQNSPSAGPPELVDVYLARRLGHVSLEGKEPGVISVSESENVGFGFAEQNDFFVGVRLDEFANDVLFVVSAVHDDACVLDAVWDLVLV